MKNAAWQTKNRGRLTYEGLTSRVATSSTDGQITTNYYDPFGNLRSTATVVAPGKVVHPDYYYLVGDSLKTRLVVNSMTGLPGMGNMAVKFDGNSNIIGNEDSRDWHNNRAYLTNSQGQILRKVSFGEGGVVEKHFFLQGQEVGDNHRSDTLDQNFDLSFTRVTQGMSANTGGSQSADEENSGSGNCLLSCF